MGGAASLGAVGGGGMVVVAVLVVLVLVGEASRRDKSKEDSDKVCYVVCWWNRGVRGRAMSSQMFGGRR